MHVHPNETEASQCNANSPRHGAWVRAAQLNMHPNKTHKREDAFYHTDKKKRLGLSTTWMALRQVRLPAEPLTKTSSLDT